jgi:hypothetical protein
MRYAKKMRSVAVNIGIIEEHRLQRLAHLFAEPYHELRDWGNSHRYRMICSEASLPSQSP